jgi:hypothetical protein
VVGGGGGWVVEVRGGDGWGVSERRQRWVAGGQQDVVRLHVPLGSYLASNMHR